MLPSPPASPTVDSGISFYSDYGDDNMIVCGGCNKPLGTDWFCSDCHKKCIGCNRILGENEYCSRCWTFDVVYQQFLPKASDTVKSNLLTFIRDNKQYNHNNQTLTGLPTPSNSTTDTTQQDK
ncbi:hypothetical protein G6F46_008933 [Rhizopus delemar]|uniref:Uncharacterized protein n=2 Tax=Rhizopus TaxID=4842 RepID=A0A9P7CLY5_9FUNG|nr:hypothetical protein G6F43_000350 [Rhizopus delemar]KAG1554034.1 hypothetical protein G6F51_000230 [Rhizopus arrhizus]KAG1453875.1 hypothetical protein G6F55_007908 [Rhizopus delemar]KAG1493634.1 hypothetical protein G6F54_008441 [Rhizopus delemar]KAG1507698.1 hypothetical protein G6F53_008752 [Rhizopus delemar]